MAIALAPARGGKGRRVRPPPLSPRAGPPGEGLVQGGRVLTWCTSPPAGSSLAGSSHTSPRSCCSGSSRTRLCPLLDLRPPTWESARGRPPEQGLVLKTGNVPPPTGYALGQRLGCRWPASVFILRRGWFFYFIFLKSHVLVSANISVKITGVGRGVRNHCCSRSAEGKPGRLCFGHWDWRQESGSGYAPKGLSKAVLEQQRASCNLPLAPVSGSIPCDYLMHTAGTR